MLDRGHGGWSTLAGRRVLSWLWAEFIGTRRRVGYGQDAVHSGPGSGHYQFPGVGRQSRRRHRGGRAEGVSADLPEERLGRARSERDLVEPGQRCGRGPGADEHRGLADRRHRDHQSAGNRGRLGPQDERARLQRDRLAGPADRGVLRRAQEGRTGREDPAQDRAGARRLFLRDQGPLDSGQRARGPAARGGGRTGLRHRRFLAHLEADAGPRPRDRHQQRQPDAAVQHPRAEMGRGALHAVRCPDVHAARGQDVQRGGRRDGGRVRLRGDPHRRDRGRPAGGHVRPDVHRRGHDQEHLRHRLLHHDEHRRPRPSTPRTICSRPSPGSWATR